MRQGARFGAAWQSARNGLGPTRRGLQTVGPAALAQAQVDPELPEPQTSSSRKPATEGGPCIGEAVERCRSGQSAPSTIPPPFRKSLFPCHGERVPASDLASLGTTEEQPALSIPAAGESLRSRPRRPAGPQRQGPLAAYARAWSARTTSRPAPRPDHPRLPGGAGGPAMGLPQQPDRGLLPELRGDRRQGRVLPRYGLRGDQGAGAGRCADLAAPHRPHPRALRATCSAWAGAGG